MSEVGLKSVGKPTVVFYQMLQRGHVGSFVYVEVILIRSNDVVFRFGIV